MVRNSVIRICACVVVTWAGMNSLTVAEEQPITPGQAIVEVSEQTFDFGYVPQNSKITHVYWIKNTGNDVLHIQDVKPGCGCTKAPLSTNEVAAGDSTYVELEFSTGHYDRLTTKSARIISNSASNPPRLTFTAHPLPTLDSLKIFSVSPASLDLDADRPENLEASWKYDITIKNVSDAPISLALVSPPAMEGITVDVPTRSINPGRELGVTVRFDQTAADELFSKSFTLQADDEASSRFTVPISKTMRWGPAANSSL